MKRLLLFFILLSILENRALALPGDSLSLTSKRAAQLAELPLRCITQEYPNKLGQVLNNPAELQGPEALHPIFYGCFDWHSSVHGHWLLVRLLREFPDMSKAGEIRALLNTQFTAEKVKQETDFFRTRYNESFERTYGWAWLLKLQEELINWQDPQAQQWAKQLQPLADFIVEKYVDFLPKQYYPNRTGEHVNTAFGMSFALDYARTAGNTDFEKLLCSRARDYYVSDSLYPLRFEPGGSDFLSPGLEEADLMRRVLSETEFSTWTHRFLPELTDPEFTWEPGKVSDRTDGKLVHLDGLNFSRAWCLYGIAGSGTEYAHLRKLADRHLAFSLPAITDGNYMGEHWLASFAVYALLSRN